MGRVVSTAAWVIVLAFAAFAAPSSTSAPAYPYTLLFDFCWSTGNCAQATWTMQQDGSFVSSGGSPGTYTEVDDRIFMRYDAGTQYSARRRSVGCFEGEIMSFTGAVGTWRGCYVP